jgi:general secretion pathway protein J
VTATRHGTAGFTLIEVLVALALFALIGGAGFTMLDQVLRTQRLTEGRLERLAEMQRAMHLMTLDFSQARGQSFTMDEAGIGLRRSAPDVAEGAITLRYALEDGVLVRTVSRASGPPIARQNVLTGVAAADWQVFERRVGWAAVWPPEGQLAPVTGAPPNPRAVMLDVTLTSGVGLHRVALLPAEAR